MKLTDEQLQILQHSLGDSRMWRNYFATDEHPLSRDFVVIKELVQMGLMERGNGIPGGMVYYHATEEGKQAAFPPVRKTAGTR